MRMICARPAAQLSPAVWKSFARIVCQPATNVNRMTISVKVAKSATTVLRTASSAGNAIGVWIAGRMITVRNVTAVHMNTTIPAKCAKIAPKKTTESAKAAAAAAFAATGSRAIFAPTAALAPKNMTDAARTGITATSAGSGFVKTVISVTTKATYFALIAEITAARAKISATNVRNARNAAAEPAKNTAVTTIYAWKAATGTIILTAANPAKTALKKMRCVMTAAFAQSAALTKVRGMAATTAYALKARSGTRIPTAAATAATVLRIMSFALTAATV